ncbi:motility protein MotB, partial [Xanthomonas oryzae pv. oryzae]
APVPAAAGAAAARPAGPRLSSSAQVDSAKALAKAAEAAVEKQ